MPKDEESKGREESEEKTEEEKSESETGKESSGDSQTVSGKEKEKSGKDEGERETGKVVRRERVSGSKVQLAKEAVLKDPESARKAFEQEIAAKALSNAKKNPKSKAKGEGMVITVGAYPEVLPADGKSTAFIVAKVTDEKGKPIAGKEIKFSSNGGKILVSRAKTDSQGIAFSRICSDVLPKGQRKLVTVKAKVNPEAETEVIFDGDMLLTLNTSNVSVYAFCYWKKITPNGPWVCTPKPPYCECCEEGNGVSGLAGIAMHVITPLGYWTAYPNYIEVIGDGHPNQFRSDYDRSNFDYDQNAPCPPPPDPSNPNQQRFSFSWKPEITLGWFEFHRSPVTIKINYTVGRYFPYPPQFWTETKTFVVNAVNAVLKIDPNSPKVLAWDPENPETSKLTVNFEVETLQIGKVWVWMRIYSCERANNEGAIRVIQRETTTNTPTPIAWDGRDESGEVAEKGLYAYDLSVCVEQLSPECVDRDVRVSQYLSVERAVDDEGNEIFDAEYYGYDDKGTEEVEDDDHLYFIRWYVLKDKEGRDASEESEIWLFDPDLNLVKTWRVKELPCLEHEGAKDGIKASEGGVRHGILVAVPVSLMEKSGTYYFVLHFLDNHPDKYKDHKVKPALEMNALWRGERVALVGIKFFALDSANQEHHFSLYTRHLPQSIRRYWRRHLCPDTHTEHGHQKPFYPNVTSHPQWKRYLYSIGLWKGKLTLCKYPERVAVPMGWRLKVKADIDANLSTPYIVRIKLICENMEGWNGQTSFLAFTHPNSGEALSPLITINNWDNEDYNSLVWVSSPLPSQVNRWVIKLKWEIWYYPQSQPSKKQYYVETNTHVIYSTLSEPLSCGIDEWEHPWYIILDKATKWAAGQGSTIGALEKITKEIYDMPLFDYPGDWNLLRPFASWTRHSIELDNNAENVSNDLPGNNGLYPLLPNSSDLSSRYAPIHDAKAQCTDAASILVVLFRAIGVNATTLVIGDPSGAFWTKMIDPIGAPGWMSVEWNYHHLVDLQTASPAGPLYDACLTLDQGGHIRYYVVGTDWSTYESMLKLQGSFIIYDRYIPEIVEPYYHGNYLQGSEPF